MVRDFLESGIFTLTLAMFLGMHMALFVFSINDDFGLSLEVPVVANSFSYACVSGMLEECLTV